MKSIPIALYDFILYSKIACVFNLRLLIKYNNKEMFYFSLPSQSSGSI